VPEDCGDDFGMARKLDSSQIRRTQPMLQAATAASSKISSVARIYESNRDASLTKLVFIVISISKRSSSPHLYLLSTISKSDCLPFITLLTGQFPHNLLKWSNPQPMSRISGFPGI
jgi:hypothetical protein